MFFPIRTDRRLRYVPWVNYALIAANVVTFLTTASRGSAQSLSPYLLNPVLPETAQFITYQFLHASWEHLLGNMLFLYVFGNSVEDRLGKVGYLCFYLAGGVLAGIGHALVEPNFVLGASGAVAAVSGAYLVLFPVSNVTIVYWFIFIGTFEVSSMILILFYIAQDAVMYVMHFGGVAYLAHLSGYAYGFAAGIGLLWVGLLPREPYDLLAMLEHRRRRAQFTSLTRGGYQPWDHMGSPQTPGTPDTPPDPLQQQIMDLRAKINSEASAHNLDHAAEVYTQLLGLDAGQVMNQQQQLDIANQLMTQHRHAVAAQAYELFLNTYPGYAQREQVELILGLIYARYLHRWQRAKELLSAAITRLHDPAQKELAQQVLRQIAASP